MKKDVLRMSKRDSTLTKIELVSQVIKEENKKRVGEGKRRLKPSAVYTGRSFNVSSHPGPVKGLGGLKLSNKYLCGKLSILLKVLDDNGIERPY